MIITKELIIQNLEYLNNTQPFKHFLLAENIYNTLPEIIKSINNVDIPPIKTNFNDLSLYNPAGNTIEKFYNIIYKITSSIENKNTYLPTLVGTYLINNIDSII